MQELIHMKSNSAAAAAAQTAELSVRVEVKSSRLFVPAVDEL